MVLREFEFHQSAISKLDDQRFRLRGWAIVVVGAILTVAFQSGSRATGALAVCAAILFALSEGLYMSLTDKAIRMADHLEELLHPDVEASVLSQYKFAVSAAYAGATTIRDAVAAIFASGRLHLSVFYVALTVGACLATWLAGVAPAC